MTEENAALILIAFIFLCFAIPMAWESGRNDRRLARRKKKERYEHANLCRFCNGGGQGIGTNKDFDCVSCDGTGLIIYKNTSPVPYGTSCEWTRKITT